SGWRPRTSAPSLRWPSQISTADRATGRPINALVAKRPSSTAGVTASMAILGEASACSTDARSAIDHGSTVDADAALAEAHPHTAALLSDEYRLRVHVPLRSRTLLLMLSRGCLLVSHDLPRLSSRLPWDRSPSARWCCSEVGRPGTRSVPPCRML